MKKSSKSKTAGPKIDPYLEGIVSKLIDRLAALDRKIDTVIFQTSARGQANHASSAPAPAPQPPKRDKTLYEAICAQCSKVCEVPFRPVEGRPVYCKTCWAERKNGKSMHGMPVLTPVALPPKPFPKTTHAAPAAAPAPTKKAKKTSVKKAKKKK